MAYFELDHNARQSRELMELKANLIRARDIAAKIKREMDQMNYAQQQGQYGIPAGLSEIAFKTTINDIITALDNVAVLNIISQLG